MSALIRLTPEGPSIAEADARAFTPLSEWLGVQDAVLSWTAGVSPARTPAVQEAARMILEAAPLRDSAGAGASILLSPADDPFTLANHIAALEAIAVEFPKPTDGRGFSIARLLRERLGWRGELRAIGAVAFDQLSFMARCGFDAFALREGEDADACMRAFREMSVRYQGDVGDPRPLFRRRADALAALAGASQ